MLPLEGVRVLDFTRLVPGPYCTMLLADFGADVVVVEAIPEPGATADPDRAAREMLRRNKRFVCLDLKTDEGRAIAQALAGRSDVLVEGFRPGVAARLGIGWPALSAVDGRLVYCSLTGYGQTGPLARVAGHDLDYVALTGVLSLVGRDGAPPAIPLNLVADFAGGGLMAAFAILLALQAKSRTGRGQLVDLAMTDGALSMLVRVASQYSQSGVVPRLGEHRLSGALPSYEVYECRDGRYLAVASLEPRFFEALCAALGLPELAGFREASPPEEHARVRAALAARFRERTRDEWAADLASSDTCVAPVLALDEALAHPHHRARGMVAELDGVPQIGVAPHLTATPGTLRRPGQVAGVDTDAVLGELGYDSARIARLRADRVIA